MIDSKKLATTPLTDFEIGSNEFCMAVMCHYDAGTAMTQMACLLSISKSRVQRAVDKGREIRDYLIRQESARFLEAVQEGTAKAPRITTLPLEIPDVQVVAVSFMCPPRGLEMQRMHEPIRPTHMTSATLVH